MAGRRRRQEAATSYGATDELGIDAVNDRVHVHDLHATILHLMGIDHEKLTFRYSGRDFRLTDVHGNTAAAPDPPTGSLRVRTTTARAGWRGAASPTDLHVDLGGRARPPAHRSRLCIAVKCHPSVLGVGAGRCWKPAWQGPAHWTPGTLAEQVGWLAACRCGL